MGPDDKIMVLSAEIKDVIPYIGIFIVSTPSDNYILKSVIICHFTHAQNRRRVVPF